MIPLILQVSEHCAIEIIELIKNLNIFFKVHRASHSAIDANPVFAPPSIYLAAACWLSSIFLLTCELK